MKQNTKKVTGFRYLLLYFLLYSFIGWLLETSYSFVVLGHFTKRGFLFGPLCPIYGWGAVILISILNKYKSNSLKLFFYSAIIFSVFEYIAGFALDALFAARWWDNIYKPYTSIYRKTSKENPKKNTKFSSNSHNKYTIYYNSNRYSFFIC